VYLYLIIIDLLILLILDNYKKRPLRRWKCPGGMFKKYVGFIYFSTSYENVIPWTFKMV